MEIEPELVVAKCAVGVDGAMQHVMVLDGVCVLPMLAPLEQELVDQVEEPRLVGGGFH